MAIPAATTMTQTDTLPGEEIEFSIGDPRWVMRSQADLYSNRELAVVREYSTNAFDANKQKALDEGVDIPAIEVTLPTPMNPYFKVRDYGYGMTRDILADVYTKFGTSTKRDSNHFNGMLGYGSKSAVAYSTQFTVTSVADGIKTIAVVTRKPDWSIVMKIVSQVQSDEPSGTEIVVPVHNANEFTQKANDFYKFWLPGTVKCNGVEPKHHVGQQIADGFYASPEWNQSYVVMGNVPYRITNSEALFRDTKMKAIHFVAYVDNGDVEFTPSREDLKYTDLTKNTLHKVIKDFCANIISKAQGEIDNATSHADAYEKWTKWTTLLGSRLFDSLTYKGDVFKADYPVNAFMYRYGVRGGSYNIRNSDIDTARTTLFVMDFSTIAHANPSSSQKSMAQNWISTVLRGKKGWQGRIERVFFVRAASIDSVWLDQTKDNFVTWEQIKADTPKAPPKPRTYTGLSKAYKGTFELYGLNGKGGWKHVPDDYDKNKYFFVTTAERKAMQRITSILELLPKDKQDTVVVEVPANRLDKFKRDFPDIEQFKPWAKKQVVIKGATLLDDETKEHMSINSSDKSWLSKLDVKKIDDPEVARLAALSKANPVMDEYQRNLSLAQALRMWYDVKQYEPKKEKNILKMYPLLESMNYYRIHEDLYVYMNAKYAAETRKGKVKKNG